DIVLLLGAVHETELALRVAGATHVGMHIGVALADVPLDWPGLAPEKQRKGWHCVELVLIGRGCKQRRYRIVAWRPVDAERESHAIAHGDLDVFFDFH